jgi:glycosyl transferase, family 25
MSLAERIFHSFDRIYIINLRDRADRRAEMAGELARLGLSFDHPGVRLFEAVRPAEAGPFRSIGARGAFLSQLGVLRDARDSGCHAILMLEDDCDFVARIEERLPPVLDLLDQLGFDIFFGGHAMPEGPGRVDMAAAPLALADPASPLLLAHFMGFARSAIEALVPYLEAMLERPAGSPEGGPMDVDGAYNWFRAGRPDLSAWLALPQLGHQRPSRTDISPPGPLDRLPGPLARMVRSMRRAAQRRRV